MYTLIALLIAVSFTIVCRNALKRNPAPFYTAFAVIAAFYAILKFAGGSVPAFVTAGLLPMITGGFLAAALFLIVMITGVFANGSTPRRFLAPIRGPLSILACILTFSHAAADLPSMLSGQTGGTAVSGPAAESGAAAENGSDSSKNPDESSSRQDSAASGDENDSGSSSSGSSGSASSSPGTYQDGTYEGSGTGRNGTIDVTVTVSGGKITAIEINDNLEDEKWLARAESVIDEIIAANGTDVDTVSGATFSSSGIIEAVSDALKDA